MNNFILFKLLDYILTVLSEIEFIPALYVFLSFILFIVLILLVFLGTDSRFIK